MSAKDNLEWTLFLLNACGPMGASQIRDMFGLTRGQVNYMLFKSGQFIRDGQRAEWCPRRLSAYWNDDATEECGQPFVRSSETR
jgi:hypothetical protein